MWDLDHKESLAPKNWCFWIMVLEKTLESPLDCKDIQPVNPKENQFWILIGRTDAETETPILWPPDVKNRLIWNDSDARNDWRWGTRGWQRFRWFDGIIHWIEMSLSRPWELVMKRKSGVLQSTRWQRVRHDWVTEWNWTELIYLITGYLIFLTAFIQFLLTQPQPLVVKNLVSFGMNLFVSY